MIDNKMAKRLQHGGYQGSTACSGGRSGSGAPMYVSTASSRSASMAGADEAE